MAHQRQNEGLIHIPTIYALIGISLKGFSW